MIRCSGSPVSLETYTSLWTRIVRRDKTRAGPDQWLGPALVAFNRISQEKLDWCRALPFGDGTRKVTPTTSARKRS
jgi:hypothetical protein